MCGKLNKAMYWMQDAAQIWQFVLIGLKKALKAISEHMAGKFKVKVAIIFQETSRKRAPSLPVPSERWRASRPRQDVSRDLRPSAKSKDDEKTTQLTQKTTKDQPPTTTSSTASLQTYATANDREPDAPLQLYSTRHFAQMETRRLRTAGRRQGVKGKPSRIRRHALATSPGPRR